MVKKELEKGTLVSMESDDIYVVDLNLKVARKKEYHGPVAKGLWNMFKIIEY